MTLSISDKTLYDLEWDRVTDTLAGYAATLRGRSRCLALPFFQTVEQASEEIGRVAEFRQLMQMSNPPSLAGIFSEVSSYIVKAKKKGALEISELLQVADTIEAANNLSRRMTKDEKQTPLLAEMCKSVTVLTDSLDAIRFAVDSSRGELKDSASKELGGLRKRVSNLHRKVKRKLDDLLGSEQVKSLLRDNYFTVRDDRYVLPVKTAEKAGLKGIVHGSSGTGQTLYIEPKEMVGINNDLIMAEMDVEREEVRILFGLSDIVAGEADYISSNLEILTGLDMVQAKARLAESMNATAPKVVNDPKLNLKKANHPLLLFKGVEVVSNDLYLGEDFNSLIISGANTGGKTVALKTMGLCTLMTWSGMHIPAAENSVVGKFSAIFTVIGDEQSLSDDLSTFSANIINLNEVLLHCNEGSLVLLDEIVVGTDPRQGAALAQSIVEGMAANGARCVVTTHYDQLKRLAYAREDFANAAVGLNEDTLKPSYNIHIGIPGASAAFHIAEELGVVDSVISRAKDLMQGEEDELDTMVTRLQEEVSRQKDEVIRLEKAKHDLELTKATYERKLKLVESREKQDVLLRRKDVAEEIKGAKEKVREIIRQLQKGGSMSEATKAMEEMNKLEEEASTSLEAVEVDTKDKTEKTEVARKSIAADQIIPDMEVFIANLAQRGTVVEVPDKRGMALVEVGRLKMRIPVDRIKAVQQGDKQPIKKSAKKLKEALTSKDSGHEKQEGVSLDLRGEMVDDSLFMVDSFLDRASREGMPFVYVIHGHGTGRLKTALREHFNRSPYIDHFRPGERGEGRDGVTVVFLKK